MIKAILVIVLMAIVVVLIMIVLQVIGMTRGKKKKHPCTKAKKLQTIIARYCAKTTTAENRENRFVS